MIWRWSRRATVQPTAALLGKLPNHADFVREACPGAAADAFDAWLLAAAAPRARATPEPTFGRDGVSFCFCVPSTERALLGVLSPSRDSAGRAFPVAVFREFALEHWRSEPAELLCRSQGFLAASHTLLQTLPELDRAGWRRRLGELPSPADADSNDRAGQTQIGAFLRSMFAGDPPETCFYALSTLLSACSDARRTAALTLECPVQAESDIGVWLALWARLDQRSRQGLSFLCSPRRARLLLSVRALDPALLRTLTGDAEPPCQQLWPLRTTNPEAITEARARLSPLLPELASQTRDLELHELVDRLERIRADRR